METYRISQLAERVGVPASTLRFYDRAGLLPADRSSSGYRLYGQPAVERAEFILAGKQLGLSLEEIAELLAVWEAGVCSEVKADLRPRLMARIDRVEAQRVGLHKFAGTLRAAVEHLDALPDRSGPCDPDCDFPHLEHVDSESERWREAPVACTLDANRITDRSDAWHQLLAKAVRRQPIPDGLRLTLPVEDAVRVTELAVAEQECCPFFDFSLHLDGIHAHLTVRVPEAGRQMLTDLFSAAGK